MNGIVSAIEAKAATDMTGVYILVGTIVMAQFGTIVTVIIWMLKAAWKASAMNSEIIELRKDVNAAHRKLRMNGVKSDEEYSDMN